MGSEIFEKAIRNWHDKGGHETAFHLQLPYTVMDSRKGYHNAAMRQFEIAWNNLPNKKP